VANRRGFDLALAATHAREERYALILFDSDDFSRSTTTTAIPSATPC
jgi:hypothetical protein